MKLYDQNNAFSEVLSNLKTIFTPSEMTDEELISDINTKKIVSLLLFIGSFVLTIMNFAYAYWFMAATTGLLMVAFAVCYILSNDIKNRRVVTYIMATVIILVFTYYAVSGQNEGFAILWILLIPMIGSLVLGLKASIIVSSYYVLLNFLLFYTPLRVNIMDNYTPTFMARFPVLFLIDAIVSTYSALRKEYYKIKIQKMSYKDTLTGLYNRRYARDKLVSIEKNHSLRDFVVVSIDVNRLKYVNDTYGHEAGDRLLIDVARYLSKRFNKSEDIVCRSGGDEYAVFTYAKNEEIEGIKQYFEDYKFIYNGNYIEEPSMSAGIILANENTDCDINELIKRADQEMYIQKQCFYVTNRIVRREI